MPPKPPVSAAADAAAPASPSTTTSTSMSDNNDPPSSVAFSKEGAGTSFSAKDMKPIKLRAACNNCFSAKVRCDGNKSGCQRCVEKKLNCVYSESRVGKVVGRRRKRPLEATATGPLGAEASTWTISQNPLAQPFTNSIPSPTTTHNSLEPPTKRHCSDASWTSFLVDDAQEYLACEESTETFQILEMANRPPSISSMSDANMACFPSNGLPTPALSPPQFRYLSPAALEARPMSRQASVTSSSSSSKPAPPRFPASFSSSMPEPPQQSEDEETVCIKLLAHLKKNSSSIGTQHRTVQLDLLKKSNASVRRILRSKTIRSNYTCHMLLSSIMTYLVALAEQICTQHRASAKLESSLPSQQTYLPQQPIPTGADASKDGITARTQIGETAEIATEVGKLIKRRPYEGFQILGRHESHHVELNLRLQRVLASLES